MVVVTQFSGFFRKVRLSYANSNQELSLKQSPNSELSNLDTAQPCPVTAFSFSLRLFFCCSFFLSYGICQAENNSLGRDSTSDKVPIIRVVAEDLAPLDIGLEIGKQSKKLFADIERRYDRYLMARLSQLGFDDILSKRLPGLRNSIEPGYQKELEGIASSWSLIHDNKLGDGFLSWDEYWLLNLLPDLGLPANGVGFGVLGELSSEGGAIVGRNLDLKSNPELRSLQAITVYEYADSAVVNIGFAGIVSVLTGFNESGLFVANFNADSSSSYQNAFGVRKNVQEAVKARGFVLRRALEAYTSTREATRFIAKTDTGNGSNTLIADNVNIQVLEQSVPGKVTIRRWNSDTHPSKRWDRESQIAVVDCYVSTAMPNNCRRAKDSYRWDRLRSLAGFTSSEKASVQDVARIMLDKSNKYYEILGDDTIQSMIYLPGSGHLYLYAAPINSSGDSTGSAVGHPSYQVYFKDLMPSKLRKSKDTINYFWWIIGLIMLLMLSLWWVRRSITR
jgi:hypothetical protein